MRAPACLDRLVCRLDLGAGIRPDRCPNAIQETMQPADVSFWLRPMNPTQGKTTVDLSINLNDNCRS